MEPVYKFGTLKGAQERSYQYSDTFALERTTGLERLVIAPSGQHVLLLCDLLSVMPEPFGVLYVLVVPRGQAEAGRYQIANPALRSEVESFLNTFRDFLEQDARHHIWIASATTSDLVVYDCHNVIYAYGRLPEFIKRLVKRGLKKQETVRFPSPHVHKYNAIFDQDQSRLLNHWEWKRLPLQESD
jgi:hypothetical protein